MMKTARGLTPELLDSTFGLFYSSREWAFLHLVLNFSGCFLIRQFRSRYGNRMTESFLEKIDFHRHAHIRTIPAKTLLYDLTGDYSAKNHKHRLKALMTLDFVLETREYYNYEILRSFREGTTLLGQCRSSPEKTTVFIDDWPYGSLKFSTWLKCQQFSEPITVVFVTRLRSRARYAHQAFIDLFPAILPPDPASGKHHYRAQTILFKAFLAADSYHWLGKSFQPEKRDRTDSDFSSFLPILDPFKPLKTEPVLGTKPANSSPQPPYTVKFPSKGA
jgi:hypothetical protein